ncbi:MAG: hypothetical protein MZW92_81100 [Comamonadaceae bacterium]|nr:hypothetical protein [Comamonadaceae bacterium]
MRTGRKGMPRRRAAGGRAHRARHRGRLMPPAAGAAGRRRPLPAFFEFDGAGATGAPSTSSPTCTCARRMPRTFERLGAITCASTPADAVFILGDLFEVWVGDDARAPARFERRLRRRAGRGAPAAAASRFMAGNRDFLRRRARCCATAGVMRAARPDAAASPGASACCSTPRRRAVPGRHRPTRRFRAEVRSAAWQREFLARPLAERLRHRAPRCATRSERRSGAVDGDGWADVDAAAAVALDARRGRRRARARPHAPARQRGAGAGLRAPRAERLGPATPRRRAPRCCA